LHQQAKDIVKAGLTDENAYIRTNAAEVVASTKQTELMPMVENLFNDELVPVRFSAILAVGDLKYAPVKKSLRPLLSDKNANIQLAAAYSLMQLGDRSYDKLFSKALADRDQTVRSNAALLLGKIGDKSALPKLRALLRDTQSSDKTMFVAAEAIARLGDETIYPKLWAMMLSAYADDRVMGIRAMGALNTVPARNALITLLDDPIVEVRLAAAEQLGAMGDTSGEPEVVDFFIAKSISEAERSNRAKALAALAIGRIKTPSLTKYLPDLLNSDSKGVRLAAAKAVLLID
ncbi:MAG: HEAT repeat domain-containing protein, partial [Sedimentisphaerales bacterium]|nr:HEAT repeat domain-containing protein [Sedimentisphaerales bacterium]